MNPSGPTLSEFDFKSWCRPEDSLSVFSLLVNSNSKLQSLKRKFERGVLTAYTRAVEAAVDVIFHVPGVQNEAPGDLQGQGSMGPDRWDGIAPI